MGSLWLLLSLCARENHERRNMTCGVKTGYEKENLKIYPHDWHNYLRMNKETYLNLLSHLTPLIKKQGMIMREAATPHETLPATLRFLETGRSYEDLKYSTSTKVWAHRSHLYHCQSDEILQNVC
jgi:hypothetical protein